MIAYPSVLGQVPFREIHSFVNTRGRPTLTLKVSDAGTAVNKHVDEWGGSTGLSRP